MKLQTKISWLRFFMAHYVVTFCMNRRRREMYCGHACLCVCVCVCVCVCLCLRLHAHTIAWTWM